MAQSSDQGHDTDTTGQERLLRAQLAIEPHPDSNCAVVDAGPDVDEITHHLKSAPTADPGETPGDRCSECHTELAFDDEEHHGRSYLKSAVSTRCICPVFERYDCIPTIKAVKSGAIIVVLTTPTRETLREIIEDLREVGATVTVEWLVNGADRSQTAEIDVSSITDKQQEALELAMESGYYETPRQSDLSEIASELEITESAASQRLNAAETKLVKSFLEE